MTSLGKENMAAVHQSMQTGNIRRRVLLIAISLLALFGLANGLLRSPEPYYQGRSVRAWWNALDQLPTDTRAQWEAARTQLTNLVQGIGPAGLPYYLTCLEYEPPADWYRETDWWVRGKTRGYVRLPQRQDFSIPAATCIELLGAKAAPAIPELERLLSNPEMRYLAAAGLAAIGPAALPVLSNIVVTAPDLAVRKVALGAVGDLGPQAQPVIGWLWEMVHEKAFIDPSLADLSLRVLVEVETNRPALLPQLILQLHDVDLAGGAAYGLWRLGPTGDSVLQEALTNENSDIRAAATAALRMNTDKGVKPMVSFTHWNIRFDYWLDVAHERARHYCSFGQSTDFRGWLWIHYHP